jgi:hypothetical protein
LAGSLSYVGINCYNGFLLEFTLMKMGAGMIGEMVRNDREKEHGNDR